MVLYEVFSHAKYKRYKTNIFSKASIVQLVSIVLSLLSPFLIAYFTGGFWIYEKTSTEKPTVNFQYRFIAILNGNNDFYLASSYDTINEIYSSNYRPHVINVEEANSNNGYIDCLKLSIFISGIPPSELVNNAKLLLLFNSSLSTTSDVIFESIAYIESSNANQASQLHLIGDLEFFQTENLKQKVTYREYNYQLLNQTTSQLEELNMNWIVEEYSKRKYGTRFKPDYVSWQNTFTYGFNITAQIRYPSFQIVYVPWFWEQFKNGWIHYIAVLIPFLYIFNLIKTFIFENQLVPTIVVSQKVKMA